MGSYRTSSTNSPPNTDPEGSLSYLPGGPYPEKVKLNPPGYTLFIAVTRMANPLRTAITFLSIFMQYKKKPQLFPNPELV
jgi:hypothetical protein